MHGSRSRRSLPTESSSLELKKSKTKTTFFSKRSCQLRFRSTLSSTVRLFDCSTVRLFLRLVFHCFVRDFLRKCPGVHFFGKVDLKIGFRKKLSKFLIYVKKGVCVGDLGRSDLSLLLLVQELRLRARSDGRCHYMDDADDSGRCRRNWFCKIKDLACFVVHVSGHLYVTCQTSRFLSNSPA